MFNWLKRIFYPLFERKNKKVVNDSNNNPVVHKSFVLHCIHTKIIPLPNNFNLDEHLKQFPLAKYGFESTLKFNKDKVYYFLGLLSSIPARNPDIITENGFIPINKAKIRTNIADINDYIVYLIHSGVIKSDYTYIVGKKSLGYKWTEQYEAIPFEPREVLCKHDDEIADSGTPRASIYINDFTAYPYLFHWYDQNKLVIDSAALDYAYQVKEDKMNDPTRDSWDLNDKGRKKYPVTQYQTALCNIGKIQYNHYEAHIDININRLHSVLTNLRKDLRNFLTYDGQKLVSIDIKNCQPYLVCLILNKEFWAKDSVLPINLYNLSENIQLRLNTPPELHDKIDKFFTSATKDDFKEYIDLVSSGGMYEKIVEVANNMIDDNNATGDGKNSKPKLVREDAKKLMFYLLFAPNKGQHNDPVINQMKKVFTTTLFPKVAELFKIIKTDYQKIDMEDQHNRLSCLLQNIESNIILHRCCKRIWEEGNQQIPIFTIHDSIVTTINNEAFVTKIMEEELSICVGAKPTLAHEFWDMKNIEKISVNCPVQIPDSVTV